MTSNTGYKMATKNRHQAHQRLYSISTRKRFVHFWLITFLSLNLQLWGLFCTSDFTNKFDWSDLSLEETLIETYNSQCQKRAFLDPQNCSFCSAEQGNVVQQHAPFIKLHCLRFSSETSFKKVGELFPSIGGLREGKPVHSKGYFFTVMSLEIRKETAKLFSTNIPQRVQVSF